MEWLSVQAPGTASLKCGIRGLVVHQVKWPILVIFLDIWLQHVAGRSPEDEDCPSQESRAKLESAKK